MLDGHHVCVGDHIMYGHCRTLRIKMKVKLLTYYVLVILQLRLSTRQHLIRKLTRFFTFSIAVICLTRNLSNVH